MKSKKYASVEICQNSYRKIIETGVILIVLTDIYITAYIYGFVKALQYSISSCVVEVQT
jgi:hypothetical protein